MSHRVRLLLPAFLVLLAPAPLVASDITFSLTSQSLSSGVLAGSQLGLIPMHHGRSLRGGGLGIGVPILTVGGEDYYPGSASVDAGGYQMTKQFEYTKKRSGSRLVDTSTIGRLSVTYTIMVDKVRVFIRFDSLHITPDRIRVVNQFAANTLPVFIGSALRGEVNAGQYSDQVINNGCSAGMGDDTGYFMSTDRSLSFGVRCRNGWRLVRSRVTSGVNIAALDLVLMGYVPHFNYDVYYDSPDNGNRFWAPLVSD